MIEPVDPTVRLLRAVPHWTLSPALWEEVDEVVQRVHRALRAGDIAAARAAASVLSLCGPHRVGRSVNARMGAVTGAGVSTGTRDLINELVHRLTPPPTETGQTEPAAASHAERHAAVPE
ncbi:hypothetical protein QLQ12_01200 [Actinoplanes sp. NEAU-A12]|uniref:CATRA-Associated Small Protein domain-containing protein n=1 Tax=Actinoplanes sandaracinus TaxID=3045177 RepID=A0ABT6WBW3_9ACTN|nr:CATRA system-associated protein [Actinoplanes sandaracinus]MDI6097225.1 hypothetical protein [Actinoplanes sandaracinus]